MLTGLAVRLSQGLQINVELTPDTQRFYVEDSFSPSALESRRRVMWSIYAMDAWVGSGVDELTLVSEFDIKIQLPCIERDFIFDCYNGQDSGPFLCGTPLPTSPSLDVAGQFLRLVRIRKRVLRSVPTSPFNKFYHFAILLLTRSE